MSFDLEKFKAGQPALTRLGQKRWFVHYDPSLSPGCQLIAKDKEGGVWLHHPEGDFMPSRTWNDCDLVAMYEEPPEPRQIDWSKIAGSNVPVKFQHDDIAFLRSFKASSTLPFVDSLSCGAKKASLETGLWVFNDRGENPWPEGVIVEVTLRYGTVHSKTADPWRWNDTKTAKDIIASRCVGLEDGWTY